jgi:hypothetical protein
MEGSISSWNQYRRLGDVQVNETQVVGDDLSINLTQVNRLRIRKVETPLNSANNQSPNLEPPPIKKNAIDIGVFRRDVLHKSRNIAQFGNIKHLSRYLSRILPRKDIQLLLSSSNGNYIRPRLSILLRKSAANTLVRSFPGQKYRTWLQAKGLCCTVQTC